MKKSSIHNYIILMISIVAVSCNKNWLDAIPDKKQVIPETIEQLQTLLDNDSYIDYSNPFWGFISNDDYFISDQAWETFPLIPIKNAYVWKKDIYEGDKNYIYDQAWTVPYRTIFYSNIVLEGAKKIKPDYRNQKDLDNLKGMAFFYRAHSYYWLIQNFAPTYSATSSSDLGVPLRLEAEIETKSIRVPVKQNYEQIINDLQQATSLLPVVPITYKRPSKPAAFGLLARTYLVMDDYKNANRYADSCLKYYNTLIDFNDLELSSPTSYPMIRMNKEVIHEYMCYLEGLTTSNMRVDKNLYASYHNNDLRKTLWFRQQTDNNFRFYGSYIGYAVNFIGITTSEIFLIRAETYARMGKTAEARNDINQLLQHRFVSDAFTPVTTNNVEELLNIILTERRKELVFKGLRWSDLRRLNKDPEFSVTLKRTISGNTYELPPNDARYTFPIPLPVIELSGMPQNER